MGMLKIGYVGPRQATGQDDTATLKAAGCQVVRTEAPGPGGPVLDSILEIIGAGDELVVTRLDHLAGTGRGLLGALDGLEAHGAILRVLEPELCSRGPSGQALRAVLEAVVGLEPNDAGRRRRPTAGSQEIFALQRAGVGPVEIARRLGVSRMTVWRKLKAMEVAAT